MENLKALVKGMEMTPYQRALATREFVAMERRLNELEQQLKNCNLQSVNGSAKSELIKLIDDAFYYARETRPGYCGNLYENSQELVSDMEIDIDEFISK